MTDHVLPRRLSSLDALFLAIETAEAPMHIGGLDVLDGDARADALAARLTARLHEVPRYAQRVRPAPLGLGHPVWEDDPEFDVRRHVFETRVARPGDARALAALASRLFARPLDRERPLWEMHVIRGLRGGRSALLSKIHHCMVDGVSGVELMNIVFDTAPEGTQPTPAPGVRTARPVSTGALLLEAAQETGATVLDTGGAVLHAMTSLPAAVPATLTRTAARVAALAGAALTPVDRLPFNRPLSGERRLAWLGWPLDRVRAVARGQQGTTNDVALAVMTDGIGRMLRAEGARLDGRWLRLLVPVNVRRADASGLLGNRVSMIPVEVPFDGPPLARLQQAIRRTRAMKETGIAELVDTIAQAGALVPAALYSRALSLAASTSLLRWSAPLRSVRVLTSNLVCTNVPGPPVPLYGLGRLVLAHYPLVPLGFETGLNCALLTYNQVLHVGLVADAAAIDDLAPLKAHLQDAFDELCEAAGLAEDRHARTRASTRARHARPRTRRPAPRHPRRP
jgi:WS/DGAT/MGAT family acyltransferase